MVDEGFAFQELKSRLLDKLHNGGIHDKLLSQLRSKLFAELYLATRIKPVTNTNGLLICKVVDSLFVDYLATRGLEFSLSVFLPESGLDSVTKALNESDMIRALHLQRPNTAVLLTEGEGSLISRLLTSLSSFNDKPTMEKQIQTNFEIDDLMHIKLRDMDKTIRSRAVQYDNSQSLLLEERMYSFQRDLEAASARQLEQQLENFKRVELAKLKLDEKTLLHGQLQSQKLEYEARLFAAEAKSTELIQEERARLVQREKEMDRQNLLLKQQLLDEHNNIVIKERQMRNEIELDAKQISMERDQLKNRVHEVQQQLDKLSEFKERYTQRMEESMSQYKIDLNKEYSNMLSAVQIEKTKLHGDRMILQEKEAAAEKLLAGLSRNEQDATRYRKELNDALSKIDELSRGRESLLGQINELQLQVLTKGAPALEYEISSLKKYKIINNRQLLAAEKANSQKQSDCDALVKSITAKDGSVDNIAQAKQNELVWKQKCQDLVSKLDAEFNNSDDLSQRLERHRLKNKELERELADTKLLLHQAQTGKILIDLQALKLAQTVDYIPKPSYLSESDLDTDGYNRNANLSSDQSRSTHSHKMIPLPSQFDIHGRETPVTDRQDINVVTPSKSVNSPSMSRLPVRIPAALKEGRGMTRSPSADLRNELRSSDPDLGSLSKNEFRGSGGSLKSSSRPDLRQVHNEIRSLSKGRGSDDNLKLTPRDNIVKDISAPKPNDALVLDAKEIAAEMENLARERQAIFLRKEDESKKRQALEEEQRKSDKEAILAETKRMEQAAAKKLMEAKKIDEENTKKQQEILRQQKIQAEEDQKKKELDQIDNLVDPQLQRYIDLVKKNRTEEAKSDAQHLEAAAYDYGAGETDQELSAPENVSSSDPSW